MPEVFLSLGSNIDREKHISQALFELLQHFGPLHVSSIYESEAVGFTGDSFYNLAVGFNSDQPVHQIADTLRAIEISHGRNEQSKKFTPRTLDIDLILYGDQVIKDGKLEIPRKEILLYAFMLEPLCEIAPEKKHPVLLKSYQALWNEFDQTQAKQKKISA